MSQSESFGIVILEAWMLKKPVIVNEKCVAFAELVQHDVNGLLANEENLHDEVMYILQNEIAAQKMGETGFNKAAGQYTWQSISSRFNQILCSIMESNKYQEV